MINNKHRAYGLATIVAASMLATALCHKEQPKADVGAFLNYVMHYKTPAPTPIPTPESLSHKAAKYLVYAVSKQK